MFDTLSLTLLISFLLEATVDEGDLPGIEVLGMGQKPVAWPTPSQDQRRIAHGTARLGEDFDTSGVGEHPRRAFFHNGLGCIYGQPSQMMLHGLVDFSESDVVAAASICSSFAR